MKGKQYDNEKLINAFLLCPTQKAIADSTGLSVTTIRRYKHDPKFIEILNERKSEYVREAIGSMQANMGIAVDELMKIISSPNTKEQVKVNAIQVLVSQCRTWTETNENMERIERLENDLKSINNGAFKGVI